MFKDLYEAQQEVLNVYGRKVDPNRLYRACKIIEEDTPIKVEYGSNTQTCGCDDHARHPRSYCKHMLAKILLSLLGLGCKHEHPDLHNGMVICTDCYEVLPSPIFDFMEL